jgi:hypothetical protein
VGLCLCFGGAQCGPNAEAAQILPEISPLKRKKVLRNLRDVSAIPRRTMDADTRRAATRLLKAASPLRHRMVRNTRELLRRYKLPVPKREIKRRLRDRQVRLLVCTDAAAEGLNLQFAGVLVNYDLPWNPMKVEQRIRRIDRLGQPRPVIRVLSFAYNDTVEQDVFFIVGSRINLFEGIVGRLQPILSRLPRGFEELALLDRDGRDAALQRFLADLEQQVRDAEVSGFDIDATVESSLDLPSLPGPALTLRDLDRAIQIARARPPPRWTSGRSIRGRTA